MRVPDGRYDYIRSQGRYRSSRSHLDSDGLLTPIGSEVVLVERELWITSGGSGRIVEKRAGEQGSTSRTLDFDEGRLSYFGGLPADLDSLEAALPVRDGDRGTFTWFDAVRNVWASSVVSPALQSSILRILATKPGIVSGGNEFDVRGRPSAVVSTDTEHCGRPQRYTLLLDTRTDLVNEFQILEFGHDGTIDLKHERSTYTAFVSSSRVDSTGSRPE